MSIETQEQKELAAMVENALVQFNDSIKSQEEMNLRMSRRISQIIRFGTFSLILLVIGVVFFTWSLKQDMGKMSSYMEEMAGGVSAMSHAIADMRTSMNSMEGGINEVAHHTQSISRSIIQPDSSVAVLTHIADSVKLMQDDAHGLNKSIENINYNLTTINKQMRSLNRKLGTMVQDVNRMPSPGKMFPF